MSDFIFSLNATVPVFLVIVLGFVLRKIGLLNEEFARVGDRLTFRVTLPVLLFTQLSTVDWSESFDLKFFLFCVIATCVSFGVIYGLSWLFTRDRATVGTYAMVSFRGSAAVLGIAFVSNIYDGSVGFAPLMIVAVVPFYNFFSVLALAISAKKEDNVRFSASSVAFEVVTNPLILAVVLAIPAAHFHWAEYSAMAIPLKFLTSVGNMATPLALLVLGAGFEHKEAVSKARLALTASLTKLVLLPAALVPVAVWLGFRNEQLLAIAVMLASPTTVACYIMAKNMKNDAALASGTVLVATLLSPLSITALVFILRVLGYI